ncbi:hypothetical protein ACFC3F_00515 [Microbacterium sp. NPDC055910]|uniref:hypothetical protein n=1 Tax=Microbacterium sp. NPDC055910 TaxID=3345659 RepID=UPI0035DE7BFE
MATGPVFDFVPSGTGAWRLHNRRAGELIAYVERVASGHYEVVWVAGTHGIRMFDSPEAIIDAASALFTAEEHHPSTKPAPIPHRRPFHARPNVA